MGVRPKTPNDDPTMRIGSIPDAGPFDRINAVICIHPDLIQFE